MSDDDQRTPSLLPSEPDNEGSEEHSAEEQLAEILDADMQRLRPLLENPIFREGVALAIRQEIRREVFVSHRGPLPPPAQLKAYDQAIPGLGERIVLMAEKEQAHRHTMNNTAVMQSLQSRRLGMWLGFILSVLAIISGILMVLIGGSPWGIAAILGPLPVLVGAFVYVEKARASQANPKPVRQPSDEGTDGERS